MKSLVLFITVSTLFGAAAVGTGFVAGGTDAAVQSGVGFGLTFVPAALTLGWVVFTYRSDPSMMLLASLGASGEPGRVGRSHGDRAGWLVRVEAGLSGRF